MPANGESLIEKFIDSVGSSILIKGRATGLTKQEIVDYINSMPVYVRDEQGNILKHHAYIGSFNLNDFQKIIIDVNKDKYETFETLGNKR